MRQPRKTTDIVQLKLRLREELRRLLEREAKKRDHSLNTEIVDRLEESFRRPESLDEMLGGAHTAALVRMIAGAIGTIESRHGKRWDQDVKTQREMAMAIMFLVSTSGNDRFKNPFGVVREYKGSIPEIQRAYEAYERAFDAEKK
jgi:hypothetical protein